MGEDVEKKISKNISSKQKEEQAYMHLMQGYLLHEFGHIVLHKGIVPLLHIGAMLAPIVLWTALSTWVDGALVNNESSFLKEAAFWLKKTNSIPVLAGVGISFAISKRKENQADDFSISVTKNMFNAEQAAAILDALANGYASDFKKFPTHIYLFHPSAYSRYKKFRNAANELIQEKNFYNKVIKQVLSPRELIQ